MKKTIMERLGYEPESRNVQVGNQHFYLARVFGCGWIWGLIYRVWGSIILIEAKGLTLTPLLHLHKVEDASQNYHY